MNKLNDIDYIPVLSCKDITNTEEYKSAKEDIYTTKHWSQYKAISE